MSVEGSEYDLARFSEVLVIAVGKAAVPMTEVLLDALGPLISPAHTLRGVVVGTELLGRLDPRLVYRLGAHPVPDHSSAETAAAILHLLRTASEQTLVFFLISGGASAMIELPLHSSISLADLASFHQVLVHSGLTITEMNTLRKHVSAVKGGRLAVAAAPATQCTLLVSDVDPRQPEVIGSGPSLPDPTTLADCRKLLETRLSTSRIPPPIVHLLKDSATPETPKAGHLAFERARVHTLLSSDDLCAAAQEAALAHGFVTAVDLTPDDWEYREAAAYLLRQLDASPADQPYCLISGGELSVPVTFAHGTGGRNQHFALYCALALHETPQPTAVLSAGSDGLDGNSPAAGAVVDETTVRRAMDLHLDPRASLAGFDSFALLHALNDAVMTGPTGNNLRDLRLFLRVPRP